MRKHADNVSLGELVIQATHENPGAVFVLLVPRCFVVDAKTQLSFVEFGDVLNVSADDV